jgi:hypothetical protein
MTFLWTIIGVVFGSSFLFKIFGGYSEAVVSTEDLILQEEMRILLSMIDWESQIDYDNRFEIISADLKIEEEKRRLLETIAEEVKELVQNTNANVEPFKNVNRGETLAEKIGLDAKYKAYTEDYDSLNDDDLSDLAAGSSYKANNWSFNDSNSDSF